MTTNEDAKNPNIETIMADIIQGAEPTTIDIETSPSEEASVSELNSGKKYVSPRWDLIYFFYLLSIFAGMLTLGISTEWNRVFVLGACFHFATESTATFHQLYSTRRAKVFSIAICVIYFLEAVCWVPFGDMSTIKQLFFVQFGFSDTFSIVTAFCLVMNKSTSREMRNCGFAILWHSIGISIAFAALPSIYFDEDYSRNPNGIGWAMLGLAGFPQMYFLRDALQSKYNNNEKHKISFSVWIKIAVPIVCFLINMGIVVMSLLSTTGRNSPSEIVLLPFWKGFKEWTFWPLGIIGILGLLKIKFVDVSYVHTKAN